MVQVAIGIIGAAIAAGAEEAGLLGSISLLSAASAGFGIGKAADGIIPIEDEGEVDDSAGA